MTTGLKTAEDKERWPITFESFKQYYPDIYETLRLSGKGGGPGFI
jgi:hypothetical protein